MSGDGGPAFPHFTENAWGKPLVTGGMSLRDWFAGNAMDGLLADKQRTTEVKEALASLGMEKADMVPVIARRIARLSYEFADAMLAERAKAAQPSPASSSP